MSTKIKYNAALYSWEAIASLFVIFIHCTFPGNLGRIISSIARFAVPLFFIIAGYYLWRKEEMGREEKIQRINHKISHIAGILICAVIFYIIWKILMGVREDGMAWFENWLSEYGNLATWLAVFFMNSTLPLSGHLWYLAALLYSYLAIRVLLEFDRDTLDIRLAVILLALHMVFRAFMTLAGKKEILGIEACIWVRNWLFMGLPFLSLGIWIRKNEKKFLQFWGNKREGALMCVGIAATILEYLCVYHRYQESRELFLGTILMVLALFAFVLENPDRIISPVLVRIGRKDLLFVYVMHMAVIKAMTVLMGMVGINKIGIVPYIRPILGAILTILCAMVWEYLLEFYRMRKNR